MRVEGLGVGGYPREAGMTTAIGEEAPMVWDSVRMSVRVESGQDEVHTATNFMPEAPPRLVVLPTAGPVKPGR